MCLFLNDPKKKNRKAPKPICHFVALPFFCITYRGDLPASQDGVFSVIESGSQANRGVVEGLILENKAT
jgi:hypothetical protein